MKAPWLRFWNPQWLPEFLGGAVVAPGVRKYRNPPGARKKIIPRDTKTKGQGPKIREKDQFLTELGIDRLHPEPRTDFLGSGSFKKAKKKTRTKTCKT